MNPRICVCCGELMHDEANASSRNPNVCASCSSMADGMEESNLPERETPPPEHHAVAGPADGRRDAEAASYPLSTGG